MPVYDPNISFIYSISTLTLGCMQIGGSYALASVLGGSGNKSHYVRDALSVLHPGRARRENEGKGREREREEIDVVGDLGQPIVAIINLAPIFCSA